VTHDVRTFSFYVLWENDDMIELLRQQGALVTADEPGVARVELDLPEPGADRADGSLRPVVRTLAERVRDVLGLARDGATQDH
jgi:hypothetical protein